MPLGFIQGREPIVSPGAAVCQTLDAERPRVCVNSGSWEVEHKLATMLGGCLEALQACVLDLWGFRVVCPRSEPALLTASPGPSPQGNALSLSNKAPHKLLMNKPKGQEIFTGSPGSNLE